MAILRVQEQNAKFADGAVRCMRVAVSQEIPILIDTTTQSHLHWRGFSGENAAEITPMDFVRLDVARRISHNLGNGVGDNMNRPITEYGFKP